MHRFPDTPALRRLTWILDGMDGTAGWGHDVAEVLAPEFTAMVPPQVYVERVGQRVARYAPITLAGLSVTEHTAAARLRNHDGEIDVLQCTVEPEPPYRITMTWVQGVVPTGLNPRLPMDFADYPITATGTDLIVFSGVPGVGKSTLADAVGRRLGIPVFAVDWQLGALTPFGGRHFDDQFGIGYESLTTLAVRQLSLGQSAILDAPFEEVRSRDRLRSLADRAGARFTVVHCVCSDTSLHRERLASRDRGIPGWHNPGHWPNAEKRLAAFPPWPGDVLTVDSVQPLEHGVEQVLSAVRP
jgi:predicted kinase